MLRHAFKEWAVICEALAEGRQALILRKGGIAEEAGEFRLEQTRFWLYPTYVHQQRAGIKADALPLLEQVEAHRPPEGVLRLTHFAEVLGVYRLHDLVGALRLSDLHLWSEPTVMQRFAYRQPGLYVLPVRVHRARAAIELPERTDYAGCKTWVELEAPLSTEDAAPVLGEDAIRDLLHTLERLLKPTALV